MGDEQQNKQPDRSATGCLLLVVIGIICWMVWGSAKNNQVFPLLPGGKPNQVVVEIPDIAAAMRETKAMCEGQAAIVKDLTGEWRVPAAEMVRGQNKYVETKAEFDGAIEFLQVGLARRFIEEDEPKIRERLITAFKRSDDFVAWAKSMQPPVVGALGPNDIAKSLPAWIESVRKQNDDTLKLIRQNLEGCRFKDWAEVGK
jgi:hypothetical protein